MVAPKAGTYAIDKRLKLSYATVQLGKCTVIIWNDSMYGTHIIVDCYDAAHLSDVEYIKSAMLDAAKAAEATVLNSHFHHFGEEGGVTGVLLLAESHMSIHSWPEKNFAALDIYMCGNARADAALGLLLDRLMPVRHRESRYMRGQEPGIIL